MEEYITEILPNSKYLLTYDCFHWVKLMPPKYLTFLFILLKVAAALFTLGIFYRASSIILFLGWTYIFLLDAGHYNNHYYLYALILMLMMFIRGDSWGSLKKKIKPIPLWNIWILRFQIIVMYFFGGIAKINADWLNGYPMKFWLMGKSQNPFIHKILTYEFTAYFLSYGGLVFDLSIGFLLLFRKTRKWAIIPLLFFHASNHFLWNIGTFPFFAMAATILFFPPLDVAGWFKLRIPNLEQPKTTGKKIITYLLAGYLLFQILFPLRHWLYPGTPDWNGFGDSFAWRMMLTSRTNASRFKVKIPDQQIEGYVSLEEYVNQRQFSRFLSEPKHAWKFAHFLGNTMKENGAEDVEIYAYLLKSVNGREFQLLMDSTVNLLDHPYTQVSPPDFVLKMEDTPIRSALNTITIEEYNTKFVD